MGIVKKIFENSKGKSSQKERRNFIDELIECDNADEFERKINDKSKIQKLFGEDEKKSDTLKFINQIRELLGELKNGGNSKDDWIINLLNGKIPDGKKPSSMATITSKDCKKIGEEILGIYKGIQFLDESDKIIICKSIDKKFFQKLLKQLRNKYNAISVLYGYDSGIPDGLFSGIKKILSFTIKNSLGKEVFNNCPDLIDIQLQGENITLGKNCFAGCNKLQNIEISSGKFEEIETKVIENIKNSVKSGKFKVSVAKKLKINGKTVNELQNI